MDKIRQITLERIHVIMNLNRYCQLVPTINLDCLIRLDSLELHVNVGSISDSIILQKAFKIVSSFK